MNCTKEQVAKMIDHTLLKTTATRDQIVALCKEAKENHFCSVCVSPCNVELSAKELAGTDVKVCTVIGFPHGVNTTASKVFEACDAIDRGASEVDMVVNMSAIKSGDWDSAAADIREVAEASHAKGDIIVKVIIETCLLTDDEKMRICQIAKDAGADFVKTSTGFSTGGATASDIALMRKTVGPEMGVKASGGVRTAEDAKAMIEAGATRLGASAGIEIIKGF